jgi:hypothetical protein
MCWLLWDIVMQEDDVLIVVRYRHAGRWCADCCEISSCRKMVCWLLWDIVMQEDGVLIVPWELSHSVQWRTVYLSLRRFEPICDPASGLCNTLFRWNVALLLWCLDTAVDLPSVTRSWLVCELLVGHCVIWQQCQLLGCGRALAVWAAVLISVRFGWPKCMTSQLHIWTAL